MIELRRDRLEIRFPEVHDAAALNIEFQRTLRIPDDGHTYPLPPGLGRFPLRLVDEHAETVPRLWLQHGGVMLPMYQSEALWLRFGTAPGPELRAPYPFAVKVAAGKINAVSGEDWRDGLHDGPHDRPHDEQRDRLLSASHDARGGSAGQDYLVVPDQPWLDGYCVEHGVIRQFVAMPLGSGYSAEEQLTGAAEHGGIQIEVFPMRREVYERRFPKISHRRLFDSGAADLLLGTPMARADTGAMGLAPGGRMRQSIVDDPYGMDDWDLAHSARCFVHIANSLMWRAITGERPPTVPRTAAEYTRAGLPWFDYYDADAAELEGSDRLAELSSVTEVAAEKGDVALPENESVTPRIVLHLRRGMKPEQVREGRF